MSENRHEKRRNNTGVDRPVGVFLVGVCLLSAGVTSFAYAASHYIDPVVATWTAVGVVLTFLGYVILKD